MEQKALEWMATVTGTSVGPDFFEAIKDGVLLCKVADAVMPGSVGGFVQRPVHYLESKVCTMMGYSTSSVSCYRNLLIRPTLTLTWLLALSWGYQVKTCSRNLTCRSLIGTWVRFSTTSMLWPDRHRPWASMGHNWVSRMSSLLVMSTLGV